MTQKAHPIVRGHRWTRCTFKCVSRTEGMRRANREFILGSRREQAHAFTMVELLVVLAIIGLIAGIALPAIQYARESSRSAQCQSHLRQLVLSLDLHHQSFERLPTNGWGWRWMADSRKGSREDQPGSWCYSVLPFIEQQKVWELGLDSVQRGAMTLKPIALFHCPSRRPATLYITGPQSPTFVNAVYQPRSGRTDYAINSGHIVIETPAGPPDDLEPTLRNYSWVDTRKASGIAFVRSAIRWGDVLDGLSNTIAIGEKAIHYSNYRDGLSLGDDQSPFSGDDADNRRWVVQPPRGDRTAERIEPGEIETIQLFGGPHVGRCQFAFCDGSVRSVSTSIQASTFRDLGNRADGRTVGFEDQ